MRKGGFDLLAAVDTEHSRAFVGLVAVVDRTYGHVDRGSVRKLLTQANWIEGCGILVGMDAAYALLPSGLAVLCPRSA